MVQAEHLAPTFEHFLCVDERLLVPMVSGGHAVSSGAEFRLVGNLRSAHLVTAGWKMTQVAIHQGVDQDLVVGHNWRVATLSPLCAFALDEGIAPDQPEDAVQ